MKKIEETQKKNLRKIANNKVKQSMMRKKKKKKQKKTTHNMPIDLKYKRLKDIS